MNKKRTLLGELRQWFSNINVKTEGFIERCVADPRIANRMPVIRGVLIYLWFFPMACTLPGSFYTMAQSANPHTDPFVYYVAPIVGACFVFAMLHSVIQTFAIYDRLERKAFLSTHSKEIDRKAIRRELLHDRALWLELAVLQLFFLLHPMNWGFSCVISVIPTMSLWHPVLQKLALCVIFFGLTLCFELHTRKDARIVWVEEPQKMMQKNLWQSLAVKKQRRYQFFRMLGRLLAHILVYSILSSFLMIALMVLYQFLLIIVAFLQIVWVWIILVCLILYRFVAAFISRVRVIRKLKKLCRNNGYELDELHAPYRSVFFDFSGYTFAVSANQKHYYCRMIACVNRGKKIHISPDGTLSRIRSIRLPSLARFAYRNGAADNTNSDELEIFRTASSVDYTFDADGIKVLILNPVAHRVLVEEKGKTAAMDNGSRVGEYRVYTPNAFLRALERDCVEK